MDLERPEVPATQSPSRSADDGFHLGQIKILEGMASGGSLQETLDAIVRLVESITGGLCSIVLLEPKTNRVFHGSAPSLPQAYIDLVDDSEIGPMAGSCGTAAFRGERVVVDDIATDPLWKDYRRYALPHGLRSCWSTPIFSSDRKVLGTFAVYNRIAKNISEDEFRLVDSASHLASLAITKARNEKNLLQNELRYYQLMENAHEGVIALNFQGAVKFANKRALKILNVDEALFRGRKVFEFVSFVDQSHASSTLDPAYAGHNESREVEVLTREKEKLVLKLVSMPVFDVNQEPEGIYWMFTDVTESKRTEAHLQSLIAELETTFDNTQMPLVFVDASFRILKINTSALHLFGQTAEELSTLSILDMMHVEDLFGFLETKRSFNPQQFNSFQTELRLHVKPNDFIWVRISVSPVLNPQGNSPNLMLMIEDIRESKKFAQEIEAAEQLRALTFETVADVLFYAKAEDNGRFRFLFANEAFFRTTGLKREQVVQKCVDEVIPEPSLSMVIRNYHRAIEERRPVKWEEVSEYPAGVKYGEAVITPVFDQDGKCTGLVGTVHDITERKQAEERILSQATIIDHAHDAIIISSLEGVIQYWNQGARKLYGWGHDEIIGQDIRTLLYNDQDTYADAIRRVIEVGEWKGVITQHNKAGQPLAIEASWTLLREPNGKPRTILAINTDITEKKKLQDQVSLAQRMESLGTFAGGIAHDFNNLLTAIIGNIHLAQRYVPVGAKAHEKLRVADAACSRAAELVRRILTFSRTPDRQQTHVNLQTLAEETTQLLRSVAPAMIEIQTTWSKNVPDILADASQIHQVMMNLATNSIQSMGDRGCLKMCVDTVTLKKPVASFTGLLEPGTYVRLSIQDTGVGMDAGTLARIFEPFFTTKQPGQGTGLGLSVVHSIIKDHNGGITVTSAPGKGTKFEVCFPVGHENRGVTRSATPFAAVLGHGECILYVDDEASILSLGKDVLEGCGYKVREFLDPRKALKAFREDPAAFAAVVTDFAMPHMSGTELATELLALRPDIPVILTSGFLRDEDADAARKVGVREVLGKPASVNEIAFALGRLLEKSRH